MLFKNILLLFATSAVAFQIDGRGTDNGTDHNGELDSITGKVIPAGNSSAVEKAKVKAEAIRIHELLKNAHKANIKNLKEYKGKLDALADTLRKDAAGLRENADRLKDTVEEAKANAAVPTTLQVVTKTDVAAVVVKPTVTVKPAVALRPAVTVRPVVIPRPSITPRPAVAHQA